LLFFIVSFLPWYTISNSDSSLCEELGPEFAAECERSTSLSAWTYSGLLSLAAVLLLLAAVAVIVKALNVLPKSFPMHFVTAGLGLLALLFFVIGFISLLTEDDVFGFEIGPGFGAWLGLVAMLIFLAGVVMSFLAAGGAKALQGGLNKMQQNASSSGSHQNYGQQAPGGYGQPGAQAPGGYGQPGAQAPGGYGQPGQPGQPSQPSQAPQAGYGQPGQTPSGYGQPGQQAPGAYGQAPSPGANPQQGPGSGSSQAPPPPYGSTPSPGGPSGPTHP